MYSLLECDVVMIFSVCLYIPLVTHPAFLLHSPTFIRLQIRPLKSYSFPCSYWFSVGSFLCLCRNQVFTVDLLVTFLSYISILKTESVFSSETWMIRRHIPEESALNVHSYQNIKCSLIFRKIPTLVPILSQVNLIHTLSMRSYCGVAPRGSSIERPLLINGYAYLAVSFPKQRE
jgi:hypothetical protein